MLPSQPQRHAGRADVAISRQGCNAGVALTHRNQAMIGRRYYVGIFLVCLGTLLLELSLTRVRNIGVT